MQQGIEAFFDLFDIFNTEINKSLLNFPVRQLICAQCAI